MGNLIEQQNRLKSLTDEDLQNEGSSPSGSVPPFLVLTEISRRKSMRDAYTAQQQRRKPSTSVAEDLLSAPLGTPARQALGSGAPQSGNGIGIAAALPQGAPEVPAFAEGGLVGKDMLERIMARRTQSLADVDEGRDDLRGRSLVAAGAAMMANGSSNFMKNLGAGFSGGIKAWDEGAKILDSREADALGGLMGVHDADQAERLAALDEEFRNRQEARLTSQFTQEINRPTADMQNYEAFTALDLDEQAEWMRVNGGAGAAATTRSRAMSAYAGVQEDVRKEVAKAYETEIMIAASDPTKAAALELQIEAEIKNKTDARFKGIYPDYVELMPELTASAAGGTASALGPDPAGLGI